MKGALMMFSAMLLCLALAGCGGQQPSQEPITGGTTDHTDPDAPKEILSKNIVEFSTEFFVYDRYDDAKSGTYRIQIEDNEKGEHVLTVSGVYDHTLVVEDQVLTEVQGIIDEYELVKMNGSGRVTAALPPEYAPWMLRACYDSGEKLYFCANGGPDADWTAAFRDYFVALMGEAGFEDVLPPKEAVAIERFSFAFDVDGVYHSYDLTELAGGACLWHFTDAEEGQYEYALVTDALFEGLQKVILAEGMDVLHAPETVHFNLQPDEAGFLEIYVDYVSGRQIYGEYEADELPEEWPEMKAALVAYLDGYIRNNPADVDVT